MRAAFRGVELAPGAANPRRPVPRSTPAVSFDHLRQRPDARPRLAARNRCPRRRGDRVAHRRSVLRVPFTAGLGACDLTPFFVAPDRPNSPSTWTRRPFFRYLCPPFRRQLIGARPAALEFATPRGVGHRGRQLASTSPTLISTMSLPSWLASVGRFSPLGP